MDRREVGDLINHTLKEWMSAAMADLAVAGISFEVVHSSSEVLYEHDKGEGEADVVIPLYSSMDEWTLNTWRSKKKIVYYDITTLLLAMLLVGFLVIFVIKLYIQQSLTLKIAQQRVSFVNQVSHELGAPLTNVALNLDLANELVASDNTKAKYRLGLIAQEIERLNSLVANVLTFSHHERGTLAFASGSCVPNEIIEKLLESYQPALERKEIEVSFVPGEAVTVSADSDAVVQIVTNLLSNVEKYAFSGHYLSIKTFIRDDCSVISVEDRGPGIPRYAIDKVFKSFERVESRVNEGSSGAGLGLCIAKSLATEIGGDLQLVSYENGCTFELSLLKHRTE